MLPESYGTNGDDIIDTFSQVDRTGIARSTEPVDKQSHSPSSPPARKQVRTPNRSKKRKPILKHSKIVPKSLCRVSQEPLGARVSPKSARKRSKRTPKQTQGRPWGSTRVSQERPRPPKERPEEARALARGALGDVKSILNRLPKRNKPNLRKVLRDSALPMFQAHRSAPDAPRIAPKSSQVGPSSPSIGLLDRLWPLEGASSGLLGRSWARLGRPSPIEARRG